MSASRGAANSINRQWLLGRRPTGPAVVADFRYAEVPTEMPDLRDGQILLENAMFGLAPTMRNWMDPPGNSYYPSVPLGQPMLAPSAGRVLDSANPRFPIGARVSAISSWQDYEVIDTRGRSVRPMSADVSFSVGMGPLGMNALTAYMGIMEVGRPRAGETVLVSGAAGSTGSIAAQIGSILGCRVVGVAGSTEKCAWLTSVCGLDAAVDYSRGDLAEQIAAVCPDGVDVFYDNVGGPILQCAVEVMNRYGRIVLCGQISGYGTSKPIPGPTNMMRLIYGGITMRGFLLGDFEEKVPAAQRQLFDWLVQGRLVHREDVRKGFENLPTAFGALFDGTNAGTLLVSTQPYSAP